MFQFNWAMNDFNVFALCTSCGKEFQSAITLLQKKFFLRSSLDLFRTRLFLLACLVPLLCMSLTCANMSLSTLSMPLRMRYVWIRSHFLPESLIIGKPSTFSRSSYDRWCNPSIILVNLLWIDSIKSISFFR